MQTAAGTPDCGALPILLRGRADHEQPGAAAEMEQNMCNNCYGGNSCLWIILILIILFGWGGNGCNNGCGNSNCGCNSGCC